MKTTKFILGFFMFIFLTTKTNAQFIDAGNLKISGNVEAYYEKDNDINQAVSKFSGTAPFTDESRLDVASLTIKYDDAKKLRGIFTVQFGDIPDYNWAPYEKRFIQEANVGFSPAENLWIDGGFFLTHIGAESAIPKSNYLTSIALPTYFEPFYQSGLKVSYIFSDKVNAALFVLNGYNQLDDNNKNKSFGLQIGITPNSQTAITYNNILGNEQPPGSVSKIRFYNNLVFKYIFNNKFEILTGIDFAIQGKSKISDSTASASLFGALLSMKYTINKNFSATIRGDYFSDPDGVLSGLFLNTNGALVGFKGTGVTAGIEYRPVGYGYVRLESRYLMMGDDVKIFDNGNKDYKIEGIFTLGAEF
ncbi:MAG TPA: outer membrane beta-barrel protein [Ignavibacteria bacterium]|nr:outer membrane beta-barrel protein [Ignavibacteria bacterium]